MDKLDAALAGGLEAQRSVIGSMLIDEECVPLVLSELRPDDFVDGTCRAAFIAIRKLTREGCPVDPVTVIHAIPGGDGLVGWIRETMERTPTAANVEPYIGIVREKAALHRFRELCKLGLECFDYAEAAELARKMPLVVSATDRMPMMSGPERMVDFDKRMKSKEKPKYLPWGIPTADRSVYAELGDMILLGGYASSGKTLLSILMAQTQAKAGYKVGYYSVETSPQKMTDRQLSGLAQVPLWKIKTKEFSEEERARLVEAERFGAMEGSFPIMDASGFSAEDITAHAIGHGFQVIYVDYVQNLVVPGIRATENYAKVTAISQTFKTFSRRTKTAVVALAQLSRPYQVRKGEKTPAPTMHSFKESGQLEQDADVAFLVYPIDMNSKTSNRMFKIGKNKEGPRDWVELAFHGEIQTMVELEKRPENEMINRFYAEGKAIQQKNRARAAQDRQIEFRELTDGDEDNPFA